MKPFEELTERGQVQRLRSIAARALETQGLHAGRVRLLAVESNTLFRADLTDGRRVVVRVGDPRANTAANMGVETAWLDSLHEEGLPVPRVVRGPLGESVLSIGSPGVPGVRPCVVFEWVPGRVIGGSATRTEYRSLGRLSARLHASPSARVVPDGARAWNRTFYYSPEVEPVVVWDPAHSTVFTRRRRELIERALALVEPMLEQLWTAGPVQLVHGDLHPWNVHVVRSQLWALDFEDVMAATPSQDIAITLFYNRDRPDHGQLAEAFRQGYSEVAPWPIASAEVMPAVMAARTIMFMNHVGPDPAYASFMDRATERLRRYVARPDVIPLMPPQQGG